MIYYFSGTGNSKWIAGMMAKLTGDNAISITEKANQIVEESQKGRQDLVGVIFPIYAWEVPPIMKDFILEKLVPLIEQKKDIYRYGIATCGGEAGYAFEKMKKYFHLDGNFTVVMPDNYIMMFDSDKEEIIEKKLKEAKLSTEIIARYVNEKKTKHQVKIGSLPRLKTYLTAPIFNLSISDKAFYVEESCLDCGLCASKCPVGNIVMADKKPSWKGKCIHCAACINYCPTESIQYGKKTVERKRYNCEKALEDFEI